jgi:uncharacterized protein (DUF2236 family)
MMPLPKRVNAERVMLLAWSRAILLQLAHPLMAAAVAEHSTFRAGRLAAARRLHHTVRAMLSLTFGSGAEYAAAIERILAIHRRVHGRLRTDVGPFPAGTPYSAEDPALVLWVHATLIESVVIAYDAIVAPLDARDRDTYCREAAATAIALGAAEDEVPRSWNDLIQYVARMHASGALVVGEDARDLAAAVLAPPFGVLAAPLAALNRLLTRAWLPSRTREQYGWHWGERDERRLRRALRALRLLQRLTPRTLRWWPEARRALTLREPLGASGRRSA